MCVCEIDLVQKAKGIVQASCKESTLTPRAPAASSKGATMSLICCTCSGTGAVVSKSWMEFWSTPTLTTRGALVSSAEQRKRWASTTNPFASANSCTSRWIGRRSTGAPELNPYITRSTSLSSSAGIYFESILSTLSIQNGFTKNKEPEHQRNELVEWAFLLFVRWFHQWCSKCDHSFGSSAIPTKLSKNAVNLLIFLPCRIYAWIPVAKGQRRVRRFKANEE